MAVGYKKGSNYGGDGGYGRVASGLVSCVCVSVAPRGVLLNRNCNRVSDEATDRTVLAEYCLYSTMVGGSNPVASVAQ